MKARLGEAIILALAATLFCAPGGLMGQDEESRERDFIGVKGGFSLLPDASAQAVYPGVYPNKPVFGIFIQGSFFDEGWHSGWIEALYVDQSAFSDVFLRDGLGQIVDTVPVECTRSYLEFIVGCKLLSRYRTVTPFLLAGGAMSVLLKTTRTPDIIDPEQPGFRGPAFSGVIGLGFQASVGRLFLSLDVRFEYMATRAFSDAPTPKPDALLFTAGMGWRLGRS